MFYTLHIYMDFVYIFVFKYMTKDEVKVATEIKVTHLTVP